MRLINTTRALGLPLYPNQDIVARALQLVEADSEAVYLDERIPGSPVLWLATNDFDVFAPIQHWVNWGSRGSRPPSTAALTGDLTWLRQPVAA